MHSITIRAADVDIPALEAIAEEAIQAAKSRGLRIKAESRNRERGALEVWIGHPTAAEAHAPVRGPLGLVETLPAAAIGAHAQPHPPANQPGAAGKPRWPNDRTRRGGEAA